MRDRMRSSVTGLERLIEIYGERLAEMSGERMGKSNSSSKI